MLRWDSNTSVGPSAFYGFDTENRLRGQVVRYDNPAGWVGFVSGVRVAGVWDTAVEAQRAVEAELG